MHSARQLSPSDLLFEREYEGSGRALLFDLDVTLLDSVYQHVVSWREALECCGLELSVCRIHCCIGMSGGLFADALLRETEGGLGRNC